MPPLGVHERSGRAATVATLTWCPCSRACTPLMDVPTPRDDGGQQDFGSVALVDLDTRELELDLDPSLGRIEPLRVVHDGPSCWPIDLRHDFHIKLGAPSTHTGRFAPMTA